MPFAALERRLLSIPQHAGSFDTLGFGPCAPELRARLEQVFTSFFAGFNQCLTIRDPDELASKLREEHDAHHVGFAFEGAGMYFALRDLMAPGRPRRLQAFLDGPGRGHAVIAAVGAGFAVARVPWGRLRWMHMASGLDPRVAWCVADGFGFHEGVAHARRFVARRAEPPSSVPVCARVLFDGGLGRSLWWSQCASPERIARAIDAFPEPRRAALWWGAGVAAAYAGGSGEDFAELRALAGANEVDLLSGVPTAALMRCQGGNPSPVTDRACAELLERTPREASDWLESTVDRILAEWSDRPDRDLHELPRLARERLVHELRS